MGWNEELNAFFTVIVSLTTSLYGIEFKITDCQFTITNKCSLHKYEVIKLPQENYVSPSTISSDVKTDILFPNIGKIQLIMAIT